MPGIVKLTRIYRRGQPFHLLFRKPSNVLPACVVQKSSGGHSQISFLKASFFLKLGHRLWVCACRAVASSPHWSFPLRGGVLLTSPCPPQEQCPRGQDWPQQAPVGAEATRALWRRRRHPWLARPLSLILRVVGEGCRSFPSPRVAHQRRRLGHQFWAEGWHRSSPWASE